MIARFQDLIAPLTERDFLEAMDGKTRVVLPPTAAREASSLLPWSTLEGLISSPLIPRDHIQVRVNGKAVSDVMLGAGDARKRTDAIRRFARLGASIVINGIDDYVEPIARLSESIERRTERRVHVNCYAGFGQSGAFSPHYDTHDVLVVQLHGSKRWRGYGVDVPEPVTWLPAAPGAVLWEATLEPGSLIYLPRGEVHDAQVEAAPSLHLTFGLTALTGLDFLAWMARQAEPDEELRRDLTVAGDGTRAAIDAAQMKTRLHDLVDRTSLDDFLQHHGRRQDTARRGRPQSFGLAFRARLRPEAWVVPVSRRRAWMPNDGEEDVVPTERIMARLSSHARSMLQLLLDEDGLQVRELASRVDLTIVDPAFVDALDELAGLGLCVVRD